MVKAFCQQLQQLAEQQEKLPLAAEVKISIHALQGDTLVLRLRANGTSVLDIKSELEKLQSTRRLQQVFYLMPDGEGELEDGLSVGELLDCSASRDEIHLAMVVLPAIEIAVEFNGAFPAFEDVGIVWCSRHPGFVQEGPRGAHVSRSFTGYNVDLLSFTSQSWLLWS